MFADSLGRDFADSPVYLAVGKKLDFADSYLGLAVGKPSLCQQPWLSANLALPTALAVGDAVHFADRPRGCRRKDADSALIAVGKVLFADRIFSDRGLPTGIGKSCRQTLCRL